MGSRFKVQRLWVWMILALGVLAVSGFAMKHSVSTRASWKVLPYQSLRLSDSTEDISAIAYIIPEVTPLDLARGYVDSEHAVRLHVVSNSPWKLQALVHDLAPTLVSRLQLRSHGDEYLTLSDQPQIIAQGRNGVFEISIDYRLLADQDGQLALESLPDVVFMMMSD